MNEIERRRQHNRDRSKAYFQRKAEEIRALNPKLFSHKKPSVLTKSIKRQIKKAAPHISNAVINKFLMYWTKRDRYLSATLACPSRMNLNGTFAEPISDREKEYAKNALREKRKSKVPKTSKARNKHQRQTLGVSERNERQRRIMEKAGRGLNFKVQPDKKEVQVTVKKRKTLTLNRKER